ncbi:MAG: hypothetical protein P8R54_09945 [Myxococcota bacterium]|nr:hypothetical protein [Myxococcota bacterium]
MPIRMIPLASLLLAGCTAIEGSSFSNQGTYNVNDYLSETDTGSADDDSEEAVPEGTPVIEVLSVSKEEDYAGYSLAIVINATYLDDDDNVDGGYIRCTYDVDGGNSNSCAAQDAEGNTLSGGLIPIDGLNAYASNGSVEIGFGADIYDSDQSFYVEVSVIDVDGNESETIGSNAK